MNIQYVYLWVSRQNYVFNKEMMYEPFYIDICFTLEELDNLFRTGLLDSLKSKINLSSKLYES
jgi:hypothetical protein